MEKICIIIQMLSGGGAERTAANMSIDLSEEYEVHLIVFDGSQTTYKYGGILHDLKLPASSSGISKIVTLVKRISAVRKIKREENIKCSISLMEGANIVNILSRRKEKIIVSERNLISFFINSKCHKLLEKYILKKADSIVSLSEVVRRDLIDNFAAAPNKVVTIYNSVDTSKFIMSKSAFPEKDDKRPYIVTMGRLTEQKAQWHIFRAFSVIVKKYPEYKLLVLGQGELEESYHQFIKLLGIEKNVELMGFQPAPHQIISRADFFVFASMVEGLGSVLLEALACGKAIISTDCDAGPREILAPDTDPLYKTKEIEYAKYGILVPITENDKYIENQINLSKEEQLLSRAMLQFIENPALRIKYEKLSSERMLEFSPQAITKKWKDLIK